jgi:hypothetical protein
MTEKQDKTPRKSVRSKKKDPAKDFELLTEKFKGKKPVRYSMSGSFKADDVVNHSTFGKGIVIRTSYRKMDVVFSDKLRILVCDR